MLTQTQNKIELLKPQEALTKSLDRTAELLQQGWLKDNNGSHVRVLAGEPGCGTTTVLRAHADKWSKAEGVVVVSMCGRQGLKGTLADSAVAALRARGVHVGVCGHPLGEMVAALERSGLKLLVLVDHVDDLYRTSPSDAGSFTAAYETMRQVTGLADTFHGLVAIVMCGSSIMLPSLVSGFRSQELEARFPVLPYVGDMNNSRVRTCLLPSLLPTDVVSAGMCHGVHHESRVSRLRLFLAGASPRGQALMARGSVMPESVLGLPVVEKVFLRNMLTALRRKNQDLSWMFQDNVSPTSAAWYTWEESFQPLTTEEVCQAWSAASGLWEDDDGRRTPKNLALDNLRAAGLVVVDQKNALRDDVYPASVAQVFCLRSTDPCAIFQRFFPYNRS